jgi:hypothetical protein
LVQIREGIVKQPRCHRFSVVILMHIFSNVD